MPVWPTSLSLPLIFDVYTVDVGLSPFPSPARFLGLGRNPCSVWIVSASIIFSARYSSSRGVAGGNEGGGGGGGGVGTFKLVATGVGSYMLGATIHARRSEKDAKRRHHLEQKKLYAQYYDDVYKLSEQNRILQSKVEDLTDLVRSTEAKAELEALQRDYDEFKQPDIDGDDRISRGEFNMYVKNYLSNYPGLSEKDYPKFDDFDHDGDGFVSFQEYSQQMALQAQQAELEELYSGSAGDKQKAQALNDMYKSSRSGELYY